MPSSERCLPSLSSTRGGGAAGRDARTMLACLQRTQNPPGQHLACPNKALEPRKCKWWGGGVVGRARAWHRPLPPGTGMRRGPSLSGAELAPGSCPPRGACSLL